MKKTILTRLFVSFVLALGASALSAQTHWSYTPGTYQEDMRFFFELRQDGVVLDLDNYEIAAFIGGECRGIATKESQVVSESTIYYGRIQVEAASTEAGATITFKAYEKTTETEFGIKTDVACLLVDGIAYDLRQVFISPLSDVLLYRNVCEVQNNHLHFLLLFIHIFFGFNVNKYFIQA